MRAVVISGEGVSPLLALAPADGVVDVGHVMAGDTATATCKLTNTSKFPLTFSIASTGRAYSNHNGSAVFVITPQQGRVEPGVEVQLRITFSPDHVSRSEFIGRFEVLVPNQTSEMPLTIRGRSWARQVRHALQWTAAVAPGAGVFAVSRRGTPRTRHGFGVTSVTTV